MGTKRLQPWAGAAWVLTRRQHGVVTRRQLLDLGMPPGAIRSRLEHGRLHRLWAGVYAVGRPEVGRLGRFKGATLACGDEARLSGRSAAALWGIGPDHGGPIEVAVPSGSLHRRQGIRLSRRARPGRCRQVRAIPVDDPVSVLVDLAAALEREEVEDAVNEADLPPPETQRRLGRHRVDFFWPRLGLVVETDSLRHHRTAAEQEEDIRRDYLGTPASS